MPESPTTPKASSKPLAPLGTPERARKRRSSATQKIVAAAEVVKPFVPHWPWKLPWWLNYVLSILAVVLPLLVVGSVFLIGISNCPPRPSLGRNTRAAKLLLSNYYCTHTILARATRPHAVRNIDARSHRKYPRDS